MQSHEIRKRFLDFFAAREHRVVRSSSLVPAHDPTLLFSNAGMNQFKDVFLGAEKRDYTRACSSQKCVRAGGKHNDLEQVGRTARHHTFFEMLGNFSFGDYFKKQAIPWAWELITQEFAIPREKLYVTVFREDDEAETIWANDVGVPRDRIFRLDEKDNFWAMGDTGPCGPCSEIHYDMGPAASDQGHTNCKFPCDCGRYVELWNLVFMQFNRDEQGAIVPLPRPSIDTGAGLERIAAVLQGKLSNFETDLFSPLIEAAAELAKVEYGANHETDVSLRIIADHARAATFLISDGVIPSNEGRGYVLRKIMRRAILHGQKLALGGPFLYRISGTVCQMMKGPFPELQEAEIRIAKVIKREEERFTETIALALEQFEASRVQYGGDNPPSGDTVTTIRKLRQSDVQPRSVGVRYLTIGPFEEREFYIIPDGYCGTLAREDAFKLYDTYGLPLDLIKEFSENVRVWVDESKFKEDLDRQRERARASWKGAEKKVAQPVYQQLAEKGKTEFDGYLQNTSGHCRVMAIVQNGQLLNEVYGGPEAYIVLDHTPFYAEAGGQAGDSGKFLSSDGEREVAYINDTYRPVGSLIAHKLIAFEPIRVGDYLTATVDAERRNAIRRNHTGTHLLHAALRHTLGPHVKQAGSLVAPDRLRFDFSHYAALGEQDLLDIEDLVNQHVLSNEEMRTEVMDLDTAISTGAMALFGEKYGDQVRVVSVADGSFSKELCGGTHVHRTGDIGLFKVLSEASVAAGTRRIEALTGMGVLEYLRQSSQTLAQLSATLRAKPDELLQAAEKLGESEKKLRKQLEAQKLKLATQQADVSISGSTSETGSTSERGFDPMSKVRNVRGVRVLTARTTYSDRTVLRNMVDHLRGRIHSGVIVVGGVSEDSPEKVSLIVGVTKDLTSRLDAGKIVKAAAAIVGGSGGGRKDLAEAGGTQPDKLDASLEAIPSIIEQML